MKSTLTGEFFHPDGTKKSFAERAKERRVAHEQKLSEAPPEQDKPAVTASEYFALRRAEQEGQAEAAEARAAREPVESNPYRAHAAELEPLLATRRDLRHRYKQTLKWADEFDAKQAAEKKEAARQKKLGSDPAVQRAIEYATLALKNSAPEDMPHYTRALAIAKEGEANLAWATLREIDEQVWHREDGKLKAMEAANAERLAEHDALANRINEVRDRLEPIKGTPVAASPEEAKALAADFDRTVREVQQ